MTSMEGLRAWARRLARHGWSTKTTRHGFAVREACIFLSLDAGWHPGDPSTAHLAPELCRPTETAS